jgi:predicted RecB family nuclease
MMRTINNQIFTDFLNCKYKAYLKLQGEAGQRSEYEALEASLSEEYQKRAQRHVADSGILVTKKTLEVASNAILRDGNIVVHIDALVKEQHSSGVSQMSYVPVMFNHRNEVTKEDKLLIGFTGEVLARRESIRPEYGRLIHGDEYGNTKVHLTESLVSECDRILAEITRIGDANAIPHFRLSKHCSICEYQEKCHSMAVEKDDLSLLSGLGDREIAGLNKRGIFTVTQFSYTFRPRKKPKRVAKRGPKHYHALNALALRNQRIYVANRPVLPSSDVSVYLDIEGVPDRDFYYLVGILVSDGEGSRYHSFWADRCEDEEEIWQSFLNTVDSLDDFTIYHYGSYESEYVDRMQKKYGGADAVGKVKSSAVNVLSLIYAHVYFPTYSNGLKSIANYLGFQWTSPDASGIQSIVWRYSWERSKQDELRQKLINYNHEDCLALQLLTENLKELSREDHKALSGFPSPTFTTHDLEGYLA